MTRARLGREERLIEDGVLVRLTCRTARTQRADGVRPRRQRAAAGASAHTPMPRMNEHLQAGGEADPLGLGRRHEGGIWAVAFGGGQVDIASGKFAYPAPRPTG